MMRKLLRFISSFLLISSLAFSDLRTKINNVIVVKVGDSLVTSYDVQNEILTNLLLSKKALTQENINNNKNYAVQSLINKLIKRIEINKRKVTRYNNEDLKVYIKKVANNFNTDTDGLKEIFNKNGASYDVFIRDYETNLLWNTLIFSIYRNKTNVNIVDVDNELELLSVNKEIKYNLSEIIIAKTQDGSVKEILQLIKDKGFEIAARKYSIAPTAEKGGLIGWISKKSLSKNILKKIENLKVNELSNPILNENIITIVKVNDIKESENEIKADETRKSILSKKREEKLSLFSRSHYSNLENTIQINFR